MYVDITMKAAKENDAVTAEQYNRESIRIARATRELLKKFAAAYHASGLCFGRIRLPLASLILANLFIGLSRAL